MANIDPRLAAQEYLRRQRARTSLIEFSQSVDIPGVPLLDAPDEEDEHGRLRNRFEGEPMRYAPIETRIAIHHKLMMKALQKCIETPRGRLFLFMPPGAGKSIYSSVLAPAWAMGRKPNTQIILASYATSIAAKQSRKVRSIVRDPRYSALWEGRPILADDQRAVDDWSLSNGSSLMAAGLLAGITGNRADGIILDDVLANREQADSSTIREKVYAEYLDTAMTRAKPKMWVVVVQTRWHEEDLAGSILPADYSGESGRIRCRDGQDWDVLSIPAEAESVNDPLGRKVGDFLWPEWFSREHWSTWRDNPRAARTWTALFQQRPAPFTGVHFSREMFKRYNADLPRTDTELA
jgi:hypothetical protein